MASGWLTKPTTRIVAAQRGQTWASVAWSRRRLPLARVGPLHDEARGQATSEVLGFLRARRAVVNPTAAQVAAAEQAARTFEV
jgi:hypothetical protein